MMLSLQARDIGQCKDRPKPRIAQLSKLLLAFATALCFYADAAAQTSLQPITIANIERDKNYIADSVYVIADNYYQKRGTRRWLLGDHYRKEWLTPVKVAVLRVDTVYGGLSAVKEGGGKQTKSLRLQASKDKNRQYVIRSIEKFPDRALPPELVGTIASQFVKDQISSANPYAPLAVAKLADAVGVFHTNPRLVFVAHSPALNEFDSLFGNRFYLFEERPNGDWSHVSSLGNSAKLVSTEKMYENTMENAKHQVNQEAFLRARLLDILIGDWDRHEDQWAWASFSQGDKVIYYPVAKDRDQAFAKLDGIIPWIGTRKWAVRRSQHFTDRVKDLGGLTWSGRNVDRRMLNTLQWDTWENITAEFQKRMSDAVIENSIKALPAEIYASSGEEIIRKLKQRRNDLMSYSRQHFENLARQVEWVGTEDADHFEISGAGDSAIVVTQFTLNKSNRSVVRQRKFISSSTEELRLFGLNGNDSFTVKDVSGRIRLRFIGGAGSDHYGGNDNPVRKIFIYDSSTSSTAFHRSRVRFKSKQDSLTHEYRYGTHTYSRLMPVVLPGYNPDDGLFLGGGVKLFKAKWGHDPYGQEHFIAGNYAFRTGAYNFRYEGLFRKLIGRWDLLLEGQLNQPNFVLNFYGLGNNTILETKERNFNRVRVRQALIDVGLARNFGSRHRLSFLATISTTKVESADQRFVSLFNKGIDSLDFKRTLWYGLSAGYSYSKITSPQFPVGFRWTVSSRYMYSAGRSGSFLNNGSDFSAYIPLGNLVLATRIGGALLSGDPQFFQYNQLGGLTNLRGYWRSRFSGRSMIYNNNELRIPLGMLNTYLVRGRVGAILFSDNGRVWMTGEKSHKWHIGSGAGLYIIPFNRVAFTLHYGVSHEDKVLNLRTGFFF